MEVTLSLLRNQYGQRGYIYQVIEIDSVRFIFKLQDQKVHEKFV